MTKSEFDRRNAIVKKRLLDKGSIAKLPEGVKEEAPRKLLVIKGKPLSQVIIDERKCR